MIHNFLYDGILPPECGLKGMEKKNHALQHFGSDLKQRSLIP